MARGWFVLGIQFEGNLTQFEAPHLITYKKVPHNGKSAYRDIKVTLKYIMRVLRLQSQIFKS